MQWRHFWKLGWDVDGMRSFKKDVPFFVCDWIRSIFSARQQEAIDEIIESVELNIELVTALQFPNRVEYISENHGLLPVVVTRFSWGMCFKILSLKLGEMTVVGPFHALIPFSWQWI